MHMSTGSPYSSLVYCSLNMLLKGILSWWYHVHFSVLAAKQFLSGTVKYRLGT